MMEIKIKYNWQLRIGLSIFVMLIIYAVNFLFNPYSSYWPDLLSSGVSGVLFDIFSTFLFCWIIIEVSIRIAHMLDGYLPWTNQSLIRFLVQTTLIIGSTLIVIFLQEIIIDWLFGVAHLTQQELLETWQFFFVIIIVSLFVSLVHTGSFLLNKWKASISEANSLQMKAMELKEIAMQSELQSLKLQLDPHFMFNNFSTLSELINEDKETAIRFLDNLSRVYRYMIQNLKKDIVSLNDEIAFVKAYCYLIHIRYSDNVQVLFDLNESSLELYVPPISLQLLVENAIKHNIATKEQPLIITISVNNNCEIRVSNNLQRMPNAFPTTGLGLKNIIDRYRILSKASLPVIQETSDAFCVTLPLLRHSN